MALQLIRTENSRRFARTMRQPNVAMRRRRRTAMRMQRLAQAIRYGLMIPDSETGRQAKLLADIFGPQLGLGIDEAAQEPLTLRVLYHVNRDTARA